MTRMSMVTSLMLPRGYGHRSRRSSLRITTLSVRAICCLSWMSEPYQVQLNIAQAAVDAAQADLITAQAQVCGIEAQARQPAIQLSARDRGSSR